MERPPATPHGGALDVAVWVLYIAGLFGIPAAAFAATSSADGGIRFALTSICLMLSAVCFALGVWIDSQRSR
jgi:hypothetical protein